MKFTLKVNETSENNNPISPPVHQRFCEHCTDRLQPRRRRIAGTGQLKLIASIVEHNTLGQLTELAVRLKCEFEDGHAVPFN